MKPLVSRCVVIKSLGSYETRCQSKVGRNGYFCDRHYSQLTNQELYAISINGLPHVIKKTGSGSICKIISEICNRKKNNRQQNLSLPVKTEIAAAESVNKPISSPLLVKEKESVMVKELPVIEKEERELIAFKIENSGEIVEKSDEESYNLIKEEISPEPAEIETPECIEELSENKCRVTYITQVLFKEMLAERLRDFSGFSKVQIAEIARAYGFKKGKISKKELIKEMLKMDLRSENKEVLDGSD